MTGPTATLVERLRTECGIEVPVGSTLHRTHAGRVQRQAGAWSWFLLSPEGAEVCGSPHPVQALLKAPALVSYVPHYASPHTHAPEILAAAR